MVSVGQSSRCAKFHNKSNTYRTPVSGSMQSGQKTHHTRPMFITDHNQGQSFYFRLVITQKNFGGNFVHA